MTDDKEEAIAEGLRWWCSKCDATVRKATWRLGDDRFHSSHCNVPLVRVRRVLLLVTEAS